MRSTAVFRGTKLHVDFKNSHSFVRGKSSLAVARKRHILQREDYLSVDEAIGDRCPPPIESYDNGEDFFAANIPTASPIDQTQQIPSPPKSSTAPNFAAIPDFNEASSSLLNEDEDFFDDEEPRVVEQAVIDDLSYHTDATTVLSSNQRPAPTLFGKSFSSVATPDNVAEEMDVNISLKPKYKPPTVEELEMTMETVLNEITTHNNGKPVNPNSNKQVATLLFGTVGGSTKKDVLEGMAGAGNRMADLILKYREAKFKLGKMRRRNDSFAKGTAVKSALTVKRVYNETFSEDDDQRDPLILVDASAYIFRAYYSMPPIHRSDGMPTGAVMGFCKMLNAMLLDSMMEGKQPRLVLCFDAKGKTFRHKMFPNYKGNRPAAPMDLVPQFDFVRQAADAYGIAQIEAYGYEADDVIATLATRAVQEGVDANILSGDKDLMQLVTDLGASPSIQMTDPMKRDCSTYKEVVAKWDVGPRLLGDVLALAGDTADNVPGVKGIGVKTAAKLINEYGSLDNLLANIPNIKQNGVRNKLEAGQHDARLSRQLVELCRDVPLEELVGLPIEVAVSELRMEPLNVGRILGFYESMGFRELQATLKSKLKGTKTERKASTRRFKTEVPRPEDYADVPF